VLTEAILVYNMYRFAGEPGRKSQYSHGNHRLEMLWTVVPGIILFLLAVLQINVWADIKYPTHMAEKVASDPTHILPVEVTTRQWEFRIRYPSPEHLETWSNKDTAVKEYQARLPERRDDVFDVNAVHTWVGQRTVVFLRTRDVGHAFFVPVLRVKQDSMPGRTIPLWFDATESNTEKVQGKDEWHSRSGSDGHEDPKYVWDLVCTQYCGSRHSMMRGYVFVHPDKADFLAWLRTQQRQYLPPAVAAAQ
jgi:cytochrome c oxidase subunit II